VQKTFIKTYLIIFALILIILSLSSSSHEKLRGQSVSFIIPLWESLLNFKSFLSHHSSSEKSLKEEYDRLQIENQLLKTEIQEWHQLINHQQRLTTPLEQWAQRAPQELVNLSIDQQQALQWMKQQWNWMNQAIPARVIFRSWDRWNQSLWINVGEQTNKIFDHPIIAKNSPVVLGRAVVGVIDYVGNTQSHVRLLTDTNLHPSVRAARGEEQDLVILDYTEGLLQQLQRKKHFSLSPDQQTLLFQLLAQVKKNLQFSKKSFYLAKGELQGSVTFLKQGEEQILKGIGFNYDFADDEGEARDLRTGKSLTLAQDSTLPILKINDILVTTGMDGIFPAGLQVATVTKIELLKEGDYFYTLEAKPLANSLEELTSVFVLPPLSALEHESKLN
jgi:rod shape-determining protein MreC